jgi:hypothetical protein
MPLSYKQLGNTFIQGTYISIYPSGNSYAISSSSPTTDSFGFQYVSVAGYDFFPPSATYVIPIRIDIDYTSINSAMIYKSFSAGTGIGIINSNNTLIFTASTPTINGLSSFTSAGTGQYLLLSTAITNNNLIYKSLSGTSNLSVNDNNGTLTFSLAGGGTGTIISGTNVGTGVNFFTGLSTTTNANDTLAFRNILAGDNINIALSTANDGDILISRGSSILVNQLSNIGGGSRVLSSITATNNLVARTLLGASGFTNSILNAANAATDSDATAFITAASITSTTQITAISNLVFDLKQNNLWNKMYAIYPFVGGTSVDNHKYNLKDPRDLDAAYRLVFSGSWTYSNLGIALTSTTGSTNFANTFFNPFSSSSVSQDSIHISVYISSGLTDTTSIMGSLVGAAGGSNALQITRSVNHGATVNGGNSNDFIQIGGGSVSGHMIGNRTSSTVANTWLNGTKAATNTTASIAPPNFNIYLGARNQAGTATISSSRQIRFASIGSGLTDSDASIFSTIIESYQTTLSRQVIASTIRGLNTVVNIAPLNTTANRLYISNATSQLAADANFGADATSGSLSIGAAVSTTSRLLIAAGTGAVSQLRLTAFSATTSLIDGDIWYSTSGNTLKFYKNNISTDFIFKDNNISLTAVSNSILQTDTAGTLSTKYINSFGVFNALSSVTTSNTASETSIISSVLTGSNTLLASTNAYNPELSVGRKFRFNAKGIINTQVQQSLNIIIKLGSIVISSSSTITVGTDGFPYTSDIEIDSTFTIRNSGLVVGSGKILFLNNTAPFTSGRYIFGIYSQNATITTTADQLFNCFAKFSLANATTILTINESTLEILN